MKHEESRKLAMSTGSGREKGTEVRIIIVNDLRAPPKRVDELGALNPIVTYSGTYECTNRGFLNEFTLK